jgi:glutamate racemase
VNGPLVEAIIAQLIHPELVSDTLVLGCTHFPVFKTAIQNVIGDHIQIVDSAHTTALAVEALLIQLNLLADQKGTCHFMATDNLDRFKKMACIFLDAPIQDKAIELVEL